MKKILLYLFLLLFVFTSCKNDDKKNEVEKSIPVKIEKIEVKNIIIPIHTSGKISSQSEMKLSFKTGGIVKRVFVKEGETVKHGQVLAQLDLSEIKAKVNQAKAAFNKAERDFNRVKSLYKDSVVTLEQLQDVTTGLDVAKSNLEIANFNLNHSKIIAPSNGRILKRFVEENELVAPGTPIIIFGSKGNSWIMKVAVTDKDIAKVKLKDSASVSIDALPDEIFNAKVSQVASAANPYTGTFEIELSLNGNPKLVSGMIASAEIFSSTINNAKVIPIKSLVDADGKNGSVFVPVNNNTNAKKINIEITGIVGNNVIVKNGLDSIKEVITDGVEYLTDGQKIRIIKNIRKPENGDGKPE